MPQAFLLCLTWAQWCGCRGRSLKRVGGALLLPPFPGDLRLCACAQLSSCTFWPVLGSYQRGHLQSGMKSLLEKISHLLVCFWCLLVGIGSFYSAVQSTRVNLFMPLDVPGENLTAHSGGKPVPANISLEIQVKFKKWEKWPQVTKTSTISISVMIL